MGIGNKISIRNPTLTSWNWCLLEGIRSGYILLLNCGERNAMDPPGIMYLQMCTIFLERTWKWTPPAVNNKIECKGIFSPIKNTLVGFTKGWWHSITLRKTHQLNKIPQIFTQYQLIWRKQSKPNLSYIMNALPFRSTLLIARKVLLNYPNFFGSQHAADLLRAWRAYPKKQLYSVYLVYQIGVFNVSA